MSFAPISIWICIGNVKAYLTCNDHIRISFQSTMPSKMPSRISFKFLLESRKFNLKLLPNEDVLDDLNACYPILFKSLLESLLNLLPTWFSLLHFVYWDVFVCKEVCDNILPVIRKTQALKLWNSFCEPCCRLQVILAFDCNIIQLCAVIQF
jgi:hypothetical protein